MTKDSTTKDTKMGSTMATGKARESVESTDQSISRTIPLPFYTGPFIPPESFVIPSNHTADDLLKLAISQR